MAHASIRTKNILNQVTLGSVAAISSLPWWPVIPDLTALTVSLLAWLSLCLMRRWVIPGHGIATGLLCGVFIAVVAATGYSNNVAKVNNTYGVNSTIVGKVDSLFTTDKSQKKFILSVTELNGKPVNKLKLRLYWRTEQLLQQGQVWSFLARIKPPNGRVNQSGFDSEHYFVSKGIHGKGSVKTGTLIRNSVSLRQYFYHSLKHYFKEKRYPQYLVALSFGDRSGLESNDWSALKSSGLLHLMAISGLHIGLVFGLGWWLGRAVTLFIPDGKFSLVLPLLLASSVATSYAWAAGFSPPTQRALVMCVITAICMFGGKRVPIQTILLLVLCISQAIDPLGVFSSGFWLSYLAVFVLLILYQHVVAKNSGSWAKGLKALKALKALCWLQAGMFVAMLPVQILLFGGFSPISPIANLLAIPWVSVTTVPAIIAALASSPISPVSGLFWTLADISLYPLITLAETTQGTWVTLPGYLAGWGLCAFLSIAAFVMIPGKRITVLNLVLLIVVVGWKNTGLEKESWQLDILDVGHGLAVIISKDGRAALYDTASSWPGGSLAEIAIAPVLYDMGITQLDALFVSHSDSDHAGGSKWIMEEFQPENAFSSANQAGFGPCLSGESWVWQGLTFEMLWPQTRVVRADNDESCVIRVSDGTYSVLLTGDIEEKSELALVGLDSIELKADILVVPHHGSKTSSSPSFIEAVSPQLALVSSARFNPWNLPADDVVTRYTSRDIPWFETGRSGQLSVVFSDAGWRLIRQRQDKQWFWFRKLFGDDLQNE